MSTNREIFAEELFDEIPLPDITDAVVGEIIDCGADIFIRRVEGVQKSDYEEYLKKFHMAGYKKQAQTPDDVRYRIANATFRKEQKIVAVTFNGYWDRIYITSYYEKSTEKIRTSNMLGIVPAVDVQNVIISEAKDYGADNYVVTVENAMKIDYLTYLIKLDTSGFEKYSDNGGGLGGAVLCTTYVKGKLAVTVTYVVKLKRMYISICFNLPLSEHLLYDDKRIIGEEEAKTKLHMQELWLSGNSFVFQLKNGHFIISDGGTPHETCYLLDYLESLTLEGEKPVIEAWFISHGHYDHSGVLREIAEKPAHAKRIWVEGIYYNEPNDTVINLDPPTRTDVVRIREAANVLMTTKGDHPKIYRPQTGQRYYFDGLTIDIICAQEQLLVKDYSGDFNDSSTWCMFHIEGQKCLFGGDGDRGAMEFIMSVYEPKDMDVDLFTLLHHGHNTRDAFTDFCKTKTVLVTSGRELPGYRTEQNNHLREVSKEWYSWEDGTKILTFPYEIGGFECLPKNEWIYHREQQRP